MSSNTESYGSIIVTDRNDDNGDDIRFGCLSTTCDDKDDRDGRSINRMEHLGQNRQYARDMILGVNDGIISTFLLVAGVSGSGLSTDDILFTAVAGAVAGAVSMSAGEFIATKSQNEVLHGEIGLEKIHIRDHQEEELMELTGSGTNSERNALLDIIGIPQEATELRQRLVEHYANDKAALLRLMVALEFGVVENEERSPLTAAIFSGMLFFLGSLPSVVPFAFSSIFTPQQGLLVATICTSIALLIVGGIKTWATRGNCLAAAVENLSVAGLGGVVAYFVGQSVERIVH
jgi:VIT1/CCC1 family predicted Fe2+/Mn2+ transporter